MRILATSPAYAPGVRTRYAPTPSGYLHIGNAAHLMIVAAIAQREGAQIHLRIDDADHDRFRREYLEDIFQVLQWRDLPWDSGPRSCDESAHWAQETRMPHYRRALESLVATGHAYACVCSRAQWHAYTGDGCPGECRSARLSHAPGRTTWRLHLSGHVDPVIWRRDDIPAYHLASVVDDDLLSIDLVIRGQDLRQSTEIQREISLLLPDSKFHSGQVLHHRLALDDAGAKLSKSAGSQAQPLPRTDETRRRVAQLATELSTGLIPARPRSPGS